MAFKVLVVDDDLHIRELLHVNLTAAGHTVECAADGLEGMTRLRKFRPDAVVLDVMMPNVDGWEMCKLIRDDPEYQDVKVILLTARDSERDRMIGKGILEADEYMTKPFEVDTLLATLDNLLLRNEFV